MTFEWSVILTALPTLLEGAKLTLLIAALGLGGGIALGALLGLVRAFGPVPLGLLAQAYILLIRGTPIIVQVMLIYFAFPILLGIRMDGATASILTIAINSSAYIAENVRSTLLSIPKGLTEAGLAMGISFPKVLLYVVGPLAMRRLLSPLGNQCISSLKDTSIFVVIGVGELTRRGQEITAETFRAVEIWTAVALIYLAIICVMTLVLQLLERWRPIL